jgi:hypothetical protein
MDYDDDEDAEHIAFKTSKSDLYKEETELGILRRLKKADYYKANREQIRDKQSVYNNKQIHEGTYYMKHKCDCGGQYMHRNKSVHKKTKRHIEYEEQTKRDLSNIRSLRHKR